MNPSLKRRMYEAIIHQKKPSTEEVQAYLLENYGTLYGKKKISMYIYFNLKGKVKIEKRKSKSNRYFT